MANQEHVDILAKGVEAWNAWRRLNPSTAPDLGGAELLRGDLRGADLHGADLSKAALSGAELSGANLARANLADAFLLGAKFGVLYDPKVPLQYSKPIDLTEVNFRWAVIGLTVFEYADLSTAQGLEEVIHVTFSTVGFDTIYRSKGRIPEPFLRGVGIPESFIAFTKSLSGADLEFHSCFISYSTKDQDFAKRLHADLQNKGVRCWFAPHDIQGGRKIHEQIDEAIRIYDKLLLILSDASMNSNWVKTEIANARVREEQQKRQMLFPITLVPFDRIKDWKLFDADRGIDSAREIREYFIPDFSNWKDHDSYQKAFDRLLRDLKAGARDRATA
jgi:hypothetical protein